MFRQQLEGFPVKRLLLLVLTCLVTSVAHAQRDALIEHDDYWNLNTKFDLGVTDFDGAECYLGGLSVGGLLNDWFGVGLRGRINMNDVRGPHVGSIGTYDLWYGGLYLEYVHRVENLIYWSLDVTAGTGEANNGVSDSSMMVLEPGLNVWVNITETLMFGLGASYRIIDDLGVNGSMDDDASGVAGNISLRFTQF